MELVDLFADMPIRHVAGPGNARCGAVSDDSRRCGRGGLFIARMGVRADGAAFARAAVEAGAVAVLSGGPLDLPEHVSQWVTDDPAGLTPHLAERFHGRPSQKLKLIGVTGTNGKTTVVWLVRHLLNATGRRCGLISTIEIDVGDGAPKPAALTTPGACELSATLARMVEQGCTHGVMECSSHALDQGRCDALRFEVGVFTNLTGDHLDYHQSMEAYAAAKARLFELVDASDGAAVVNAEDAAHERMIAGRAFRRPPLRFAIEHHAPDAAYRAAIRAEDANGALVEWFTPTDRLATRLPLIGRHNVSNMLAALAAVEAACGDRWAEATDLSRLIESAEAAPGRLERVSEAQAPFAVLVDYAHTDDALRNVLAALRPLVRDGGALGVMFGCGGDRDRTKRPRMASVACELADRVLITSDNPRTEDPQAIIDDILTGVPAAKRDRVSCELDRRAAIRMIIASAGPGDIVLLAGKGHEDYQIVGTQRLSFDDRTEARAALAELGRSADR